MDLKEWIKQRSAATENESEYDGLFSYAAEFHAFTMGLGSGFAAGGFYGTGNVEFALVVGFTVIGPALGFTVKNGISGEAGADIEKEPHYAIGGFAIGCAVGFAATVL